MKRVLKIFKNSLQTFKWWQILGTLCLLGVLIAVAVVFHSSALVIVNSLLTVIGVVCLAKGLAIGNVFLLIQCVTYAWMSYMNHYIGEVFIRVFISAPLYVFALVNWMRKTKVDVVEIRKKVGLRQWLEGLGLVVVVTGCATAIMFFFDTDNIIISVVSVFTSSYAAYLSARRSELNFIFYVSNNIIQIVLWSVKIASSGELQYFVTITQMIIVLTLNLTGLVNWSRLKKKQEEDSFDLIMKVLKST